MNLEISQFPIGEKNPYGQYFNGQSYLYALSTEQVPIFNVTFEPACRNFWHIHHAKKGGGQILLVTAGRPLGAAGKHSGGGSVGQAFDPLPRVPS